MPANPLPVDESLLPTPEQVQRAKAANKRERRLAQMEMRRSLNAEGRIGRKERHDHLRAS